MMGFACCYEARVVSFSGGPKDWWWSFLIPCISTQDAVTTFPLFSVTCCMPDRLLATFTFPADTHVVDRESSACLHSRQKCWQSMVLVKAVSRRKIIVASTLRNNCEDTILGSLSSDRGALGGPSRQKSDSLVLQQHSQDDAETST